MRNRIPSSALLSNSGAAVRSADGSQAASTREGLRPSPQFEQLQGARSRAIAREAVHEDGKRGPASSMLNSLLRKCCILCSRTSSSSLRSARNLPAYSCLASGGMNKSPSLRLSESRGLNRAARSFLSSSVKGLPVSLFKPMKNASPSRPEAPWPLSQPPDGASSFTGLGVEQSNLPKSRSTPLAGCPVAQPNGTVCETALMLAAARALVRAKADAEIRVGETRGSLSRPNCTPPYTPYVLEPTPFSASTIVPSLTRILE
mmetsp:Transcript_74795/g.206218  ORF Transcript_74795/g.206218 Transcript_74795/m.206218 type:complete len:260 (-) Transcript_74795:493-1272(-)